MRRKFIIGAFVAFDTFAALVIMLLSTYLVTGDVTLEDFFVYLPIMLCTLAPTYAMFSITGLYRSSWR